MWAPLLQSLFPPQSYIFPDAKLLCVCLSGSRNLSLLIVNCGILSGLFFREAHLEKDCLHSVFDHEMVSVFVKGIRYVTMLNFLGTNYGMKTSKKC